MATPRTQWLAAAGLDLSWATSMRSHNAADQSHLRRPVPDVAYARAVPRIDTLSPGEYRGAVNPETGLFRRADDQGGS